MAEYLYDKLNPKSHLKGKVYGWESFYRGLPNHYERVEMIGRRLLKEYDGDLTRVSMPMKKPHDKGQRWRSLKTFSKIHRNPVGYAAWRFVYAYNVRKHVSIWYICVIATIITIVQQIGAKQQTMAHLVENYKYSLGMRGFFPKFGLQEHRTAHGPDTTTYKKKMSNFNSIFKNPNQNCLTTAYWCRDQNFRKYFEMRKKNGILPSLDVSKYYNKDKCLPFYQEQLNLYNEFNGVKNIKSSIFSDII